MAPTDGPADAMLGHTRPRVWRSVRTRVVLPVVIAVAGMIVLGAVQVNGALTVANESSRTVALARAAGSIGNLVHQVAAEYVLIDSARRAPGDGAAQARLGAQQQATDAARARFTAVAEEIRTTTPALDRLRDAAERALTSMSSARVSAVQSPDGSPQVYAFYDDIMTSLLGLADAVPAQLDDSRLSELARSVALYAQLDRLAALELDLIGRALTVKHLASGDPIRLAQWAGGEQVQVEAISNLHPASELYDDLLRIGQVANAASIRQIILDGRDAPSLGLDQPVWASAQTQRIDGLFEREGQLASALASDADAYGSAARSRSLLVGGLSAIVVVTTLAWALILAIQLSRRLRRTRLAALTTARSELPNAIANVIAARDAGRVQAALAESSDRIDAMLEPSSDEIGELSAAFGLVHRQALRLAADQAMLRMEVQAMFIALSRRGQTLVQRQIHLIDEFGRDEINPDALAKLFALDHLAARMRRNEENLLVLAGGEPGRWITRPVSMVDVMRAAAQEIEAYLRVDIVESTAIAVAAPVAGDTIHLLAELLENATSFSPPNTKVRIGARRTFDGLSITIADSGIGMPHARVAEVNERLAHPSALTSNLIGTMGLLVVARLAERQGIAVHLAATPAGGTTATVVVPDRHIMPLSTVDRLQPGRWLRDSVAIGSSPVSAPPRAAVTALAPHRPPAVPVPHPVPHQRNPAHAAVAPALPLTSPATPDPEAVRARLSSLSRGIAAAQRGDAGPPPPSDRTR